MTMFKTGFLIVHFPHISRFSLQKSFNNIFVASNSNCPKSKRIKPFFFSTNISSTCSPVKSGRVSKQLCLTHSDIIRVLRGPSYVIHQFPSIFLKMNKLCYFFEIFILSEGIKQNQRPQKSSLSDGRIPSNDWNYSLSAIPQKKTAILLFQIVLMKSSFSPSMRGSARQTDNKLNTKRSLQNMNTFEYITIISQFYHIKLPINYFPNKKISITFKNRGFLNYSILRERVNDFNIKKQKMFQSKRRPISAMSKITVSLEKFKNLPLAEINEENVSKGRRTRLTSAKSSNHMPIYSELQATRAIKGKDTDFLESRKQSYLNSCYNKRKNQLLKITKENRRIYERINSQQSNYSTKKGNRSMESNCSRSKVSAISSSKFQSSKNISRPTSAVKGKKRILKQNNFIQNKKPIIQEKNIDKIQSQDLHKFKNMFFRNDVDQKPSMEGISIPMRRPKTIKRQKFNKKKEQKENRQILFQKSKTSLSRNKQNCQIKQTNQRYNGKQFRKMNIMIGICPQNSSRNDKLTKILSQMGFKYNYC